MVLEYLSKVKAKPYKKDFIDNANKIIESAKTKVFRFNLN